jgi:hypothetical protein
MLAMARQFRFAAPTVAATFAVLAAFTAAAAECSVASGAQRLAVLELFTSEGCNSCPPADKWVSELPAKNLDTDRLITLAFHVDYWNQLGWTDPFSQAMFSDRQRRHSQRRGVNFVVTPQLLLNGRDYRLTALFDDIAGKVNAINQTSAQADIRVKLSSRGSALDGKIEVSVPGTPDQRRAQVYVALYENNLVTAVKAGENKGRTLRHDFVVRKLVGPLGLDDKGNLSHAQSFPLDAGWKPQDLRWAVVVQHPQSGEVLQALSAACR